MPLLDMRGRLGQAVFSRVAGDNPTAAREAIHLSPGERWFAEDAAIHEVHPDTAMFVGGMRALLLQSLHPLAMAGVAQHSGYRGDPWGRLQRTGYFLAVTTFGPAVEAERTVARIRGVHRRITGTYEYISQSGFVARKVGVVDPPETRAELREQLAAYRPELLGTPEARSAARFLLLTPQLPLVARAPYAAISAAAVAMLPWWTRWPLRLPLLPLTERTAVRAAGKVIVGGFRWVAEPLPEPAG